MKPFYSTLLLSSLLYLAACTSKEKEATPQGIVGRWQLTQMECYCVPGAPVPDEAVEFDANGNTTFYVNGQISSQGTYSFTTGPFCGSTSAIPVLRISNLPGIYDNNIAYSLEPTQLVLDQGLCTDAPRKTYQRQ